MNYDVIIFYIIFLFQIRLNGGPRHKEEGMQHFKDTVKYLKSLLINDPDERKVILDTVRRFRKEKIKADGFGTKRKSKVVINADDKTRD